MRKIGALFLLASVCIPLSTMARPQGTPPDIVMLKFELDPNFRQERDYSKSPDDLSSQAPRMAKEYLRSQLTVRNIGTRTAYLVDWDYFLSEPNSEKEVARYHFRARQVINPNKKVALASAIDESRDTEQNRKISEKYARSRFHERATITLIEYTDGTSWQSPLIDNSDRDGANQLNSQLSQSSKASRPPELKKSENVADPSQPKASATPE